MSGGLKLYKSYSFRDKDPNIYELERIAKDAGAFGRGGLIRAARDAGMGETTPHNWFFGTTKRPQAASMRAFARTMGWDLVFVKGVKRFVDRSPRRIAGKKRNGHSNGKSSAR